LKDPSKLDCAKWKEFVYNHPDGNIFQTPEMYEVYKNTKNYEPVFVAAVDENQEILGTLLAVFQKEHSGLLGMFSARLIILGAPLVKDNNLEVLDFILSEYNKVAPKKAIYSQFRNMWDWKDLKETFIKNGFVYEEHLDIFFDLTKNEEQLWNEMKRVRRKGIRQSYNKGIITNKIDLSDEEVFTKAYNIILPIYKRIKLPLPDISFFKSSINNFSDNILSLGAFINDELIGVRIALCYNNLIYDWYAGAKDEYLNYRPNDVLPWEIMKWGIKKDYKIFQFGGAGKPNKPYGVRDYKLKFGGELVNYGRFEKVHKKGLMSLGKLLMGLYKLL